MGIGCVNANGKRELPTANMGGTHELASVKMSRKEKLQSWLTFLPRVASQDQDTLRKLMGSLYKAKENGKHQEVIFTNDVLHQLAKLLWRAEFAEGHSAQLAWVEAFEESLPPVFRSQWREVIADPEGLLVRHPTQSTDTTDSSEYEYHAAVMTSMPRS